MKKAIFLVAVLTVNPQSNAESIGVSIDPAAVTVSGVSSGGHMAHQLHIAYSDLFHGAGIISGGPYGCAEGSLATAMARCMASAPSKMPIEALLEQIQAAAAKATIAPLEGLSDDPVWLFHGSQDEMVATAVADSLQALYARLSDPKKLVYINDFEAAHHFPTISQGHACLESAAPFVGACGFDAAGELLNHLHGPLKSADKDPAGELLKVELESAQAATLMDLAYLYVPAVCQKEGESCGLHMVLHGCAQSAQVLGTGFIEMTGYQRWADSNGILLLYPQVQASAANPYGCWDWWGYSGTDYLARDSVQMSAVVNLVKKIIKESP